MAEEKIKIWDNGEIRELTEAEIAELKKQNEAHTFQQDSISYDDMVNAEIRKRYTESQEFAILRQKDEKPEEYAEYYTYCEECKEYVRKHIEQFTEAEELL